MSEDMKMYIGLGIFIFLPIGIMGLAMLSDLFDRWVHRVTKRPTDDRPTDLRPTYDLSTYDRPTDSPRPTDLSSTDLRPTGHLLLS